MSPKPITRDEVEKVALLARLRFDEAGLDRFTGHLNQILDYVETLNELDTSGVPPTSHTVGFGAPLREDEPVPGLTQAQALQNAPDREGDYLRVPRIVGQGS